MPRCPPAFAASEISLRYFLPKPIVDVRTRVPEIVVLLKARLQKRFHVYIRIAPALENEIISILERPSMNRLRLTNDAEIIVGSVHDDEIVFRCAASTLEKETINARGHFLLPRVANSLIVAVLFPGLTTRYGNEQLYHNLPDVDARDT